MPQPRQPFLHDLVTVVAAPTQVLSDRTGEIGGAEHGSAQGVMHADVRALSRLSVRVDGQPGEHLATALDGQEARFVWLFRQVGKGRGTSADPQVRLDWTRTARPGQVVEALTLSSVLPVDVTATVSVELASDLVPMEAVKVGVPTTAVPFRETPEDGRMAWGSEALSVALAGSEGSSAEVTEAALVLTWPVTVPAGGTVTVGWTLDLTDHHPVVVGAPAQQPYALRLAPGGDHRLEPWLRRSLEDLAGLRMALPDAPEDEFFAAGCPWYLTLFGRDSLWAARMMVPVDLAPARGTLRALARLQGRRTDVDAAEAPGKIIHELRRGDFAFGETSLPPRYYGTIDATPLWVCLLHDAWRAGLPDEDVRDLLPALEAALHWLTEDADADGDGFLEYIDTSGHGLANQGWKDSGDSVRFADGTIAEGPVALCEVQAYAYEAAVAGAGLLDAFHRPGGDRLRTWAATLADRFREAFWCGTGEGRYPALALDGQKRRVDSLTSNIGHLLGTGLLDAEEERLVARRVSGSALDSGLGLRTMSADDGGYSPLSYHCGSVWPHDTAIVIEGLRRAGLVEQAAGLVEGLLRASVAFDQRLPELWSGEGAAVPYPAACRPQAWSAAAAVTVAVAVGAWPAAGQAAPGQPATGQPAAG